MRDAKMANVKGKHWQGQYGTGQHSGRKRSRRIVAPLITAIMIGGYGCPAIAQVATSDPQAAENGQFDDGQYQANEIIVTARKVSENIQEAPLTVTAFSAQDIADSGIRETADFIQLTSNVTLAESQSIGTSFLTIRGLTQVRNGEIPVAVTVDGVLQFNSRQFVSQLFDVEQIEVVKGPQGALYGRNATGGAIIVTTKKPGNDSEGYVRLGYGTGEELAAEGSFSGAIVEDRLFFRASGRIVNRRGYYRNETRNDFDDPYFDRSFRGRLLWTPNDALTVDLIGSYGQHDGRGIGFQFGAASADDTSLPFVANNEDRGERTTAGLSLRIEQELGFGSLTSVTSYDSVSTLTRADQFPYTALANGVGAGAPFGDGTQSQFTDIEGWSQELRLSSLPDQRLQWQVGAYYLSWDRFISSTVGLDNGTGIRRVERMPFFNAAENPTTSFFADDNDNSSWAVFGQISYDLFDALEISLAGRYDEELRKQSVSPLNTGGVPGALNRRTFKKFSPKATIRFQPADFINLYATWGEGFRSGQFNQNGTAAAATAAGIAGVNDVVDQEETASWELGAKTDLFGNRLRLNLAYFQTDVEGQQYFVFIGGIGAQVLINIDKVKIKGFEAEAALALVDGFDIFASYGLTDSEIRRYATDPAQVGKKAPYTPKSTLNLGAQWRFGLSDSLNLLSRADFERRGRQFYAPENNFPRSPLNLVNLRFALEDVAETWELAASVNNLTNTRYNSEFVIPAFSHLANPRIWRLEMRYRF